MPQKRGTPTRTKIVATLGPASFRRSVVRELIEAGVDVFRLNFSHGTRESHVETVKTVRAVSKKIGVEVGILADLCGPKIRTGEMMGEGARLVRGREVVVTTKSVKGTAERFSTQYAALARDVKKNARLLLDDGKMELKVLEADGKSEVRCRVVYGGLLKSHKGMNLPGTAVSAPSVTPKDMKDLAAALDAEVDFVALSFVREAADVQKVIKQIRKRKLRTQVIAKIEKPEAVDNIDRILDVADGIMVARGDLGVEMAVEKVPMIQKDLIFRANRMDRLVITATQMLESMIENPTPTRAEVSDVANAILDGTDAIMLSGETAAGAYPVRAVRMMDSIARSVEAFLQSHRPPWEWVDMNRRHPIRDAIGHAALRICEDLDIKAVAVVSASGRTAQALSTARPFAPIVAFTNRMDAFRRMNLSWGVLPHFDPKIECKEALLERLVAILGERRLAREGDNILLVVGGSFNVVGGNNGLEVVTMPAVPSRRARRAARKTTAGAV